MANIDVVPKHHNLTWVWIVIAAIVAIALWWVLTRNTGTNHQTGQLVPLSDPYGTVTYFDTV